MRVFCMLAAFVLVAAASAQCAEPREPYAAQAHEADLLHLPTPAPVVAAMLRLAGVSPADVVYDLGSGDGRIPIAAARDYGARGVGIELDARLVALARCNAREAGVAHRVDFRQQDLFGADLGEATVVTLFLFPEMNRRLKAKLLAELKPGARIVSHRFDLGDWPPQRTAQSGGHPILLWIVPARPR
ncbi:MAG: class I SAM-dependent methyltransferase [Burkholderiales bacterium]